MPADPLALEWRNPAALHHRPGSQNLAAEVLDQSRSYCLAFKLLVATGTHDQPHVKAEAATGGGRKATLYKGLVICTQSPTGLMAWQNRVTRAQPPGLNLVEIPFETSKNLIIFVSEREQTKANGSISGCGRGAAPRD